MVLKIHGSYILLVYITMYQVPGMKWTLSAILCSLPAAGLFSRSRLRDTQGTWLCTMVQVWVPAGLRGAYSGRSKSRNLASNHGITFRPARANRANAKPRKRHFFIFDLSLLLFWKYHSTRPSKARQPRHSNRASSVSLCDNHKRCLCVSVRVCARVSVGSYSSRN